MLCVFFRCFLKDEIDEIYDFGDLGILGFAISRSEKRMKIDVQRDLHADVVNMC